MKKKTDEKIALIRQCPGTGKVYIVFPEESSEGFCAVGMEKRAVEDNTVNLSQILRLTKPASEEKAKFLIDTYKARGVKLKIQKRWVPKRKKAVKT